MLVLINFMIVLIFSSVKTLQSACKEAILERVTRRAVFDLPLPRLLKEYLLYGS